MSLMYAIIRNKELVKDRIVGSNSEPILDDRETFKGKINGMYDELKDEHETELLNEAEALVQQNISISLKPEEKEDQKQDPEIEKCNNNNNNNNNEEKTMTEILKSISVRSWSRRPSSKMFIYGTLGMTITDAVKLMTDNDIHHLPVIIDEFSFKVRGVSYVQTVQYVLTYRMILRYFASTFRVPITITKSTITNLGLGNKRGNMITCNDNDTTLQCIISLLKNRLSVVPILDHETGKYLDVFSKMDVLYLLLEPENYLSSPVKRTLALRSPDDESCVRLNNDFTLAMLVQQLSLKNLHRMVVIDDDGHVERIISLRHLLMFFINAK